MKFRKFIILEILYHDWSIMIRYIKSPEKVYPISTGFGFDSAISWTEVVPEGSDTYEINNDSNNYWRYFAIKLEAGIKYTFYQTERNFDTAFWLYDFNKNPITSVDSDSPSQPGNSEGRIDNDGSNEKFYYTPEITEVFYLRWGAYSSGTGNATIQITPRPIDYNASSPYLIPSTGINEWGIPIEYSELNLCSLNVMNSTNDKFCKLYIDFKDGIQDTANGNETPIELVSSNITTQNGYGQFSYNSKIDCSAANWDLREDFTIEFYINFDQLPTNDAWGNCQTIFVTYDSAGSVYQHALRFGNNNINFQYENNSWYVSTQMKMQVGKWYHFALSKENITFRMFIDGVLVGESQSSRELNVYPNAQIGYEANEAYFRGKLTNFNLSIGIARYKENFKPIKIAGIYNYK